MKLRKLEGTWGIKSGTIYMAFSYTLNTLFIFGFQTIAVRLLKPDYYGLVSVLYSSVVFVSFFLGHTFEFTLSKYISELEAKHNNYVQLVQRIWVWQGATLLVFTFLSFSLRGFIVDRLFPEAPIFFYIFIACGIFYSVEIGLKGVIRGLREFGIFGTLTFALNFIRIIYLILFVGILKYGLLGAGLSILLASVTNILLIILWYRKNWMKIRVQHQGFQNSPTYRQLSKYVLPTMAMFAVSTYFYNTGPSFIKLLGGESANETAGLFLIAVMISRLPLQLSEALSINLLPNMSRLIVQGDWRGIRYYILKSYQIFIPLLFICLVGIYIFGPLILRFIYPEFTYSRLGLNILVLSIGVIMLTAAFIQFLLADNRVMNVVVGWMVGGIILTLVVFWMPGDILVRLETGYLAGAISIWMCMGTFTYHAMKKMKANQKELSQEAAV